MNVRVGPQLQSGHKLYPPDTRIVNWVMHPDDYRTFWSGASTELDACASIYGSQGFETDAVGFVWGLDLVWDDERNEWTLGGPKTSWDRSAGTLPRKSIKNLMNEIDNHHQHPLYDEVRTLLLNRVRVFLTRGILATFVYAENEATRRLLMSLHGGE